MAIINSVFMGRAKKSAGNATFRTVRGRTIASQKVAKKGSMSGNLSANQYAMACISRFASIFAFDITASFDPTTYGSSRNAFFKVNYTPLKKAFNPLYVESLKHGADKLPTDSQIIAAVETYATENPNEIYRIKKHGYEAVYLNGAWSSEDNPDGAAGGSGKVRLSVTCNPEDAAVLSGSGYYTVGESVQISATANTGFNFNQWSDGSTDNPRTVTIVEGENAYTAQFGHEFS